MKYNNITILSLRLMSIYFVVQGLGMIPISVINLFDMSFSILIVPIFNVISGGLLFCLAPKLSPWIIPSDEGDGKAAPFLLSEKTARIAFVVLGLYILSNALPYLIYLATELLLSYQKLSKYPGSVSSGVMQWPHLIIPGFKLLLSLVLIFGSNTIYLWISKYDVTLKGYRDTKQNHE